MKRWRKKSLFQQAIPCYNSTSLYFFYLLIFVKTKTLRLSNFCLGLETKKDEGRKVCSNKLHYYSMAIKFLKNVFGSLFFFVQKDKNIVQLQNEIAC
jgi:hypothetical protein